jgi:hypothetical protein
MGSTSLQDRVAVAKESYKDGLRNLDYDI